MNIFENNFSRKHLYIFLGIWILCLLIWFLEESFPSAMHYHNTLPNHRLNSAVLLG